MSTLTQQATDSFELLRKYINEECGIAVAKEKSYLFESRLKQFLIEHRCSDYNELYHKAVEDRTGKLRERIVDAITTNETYWFRDEKPWNLIREHLIPKLIEDIEEGRKRKVRIWSAACSTGQEPYSLAMLIDAHINKHKPKIANAHSFEIVATDISPSALFLAISGRYNSIAMSRGIEDSFLKQYFNEKGGVFEISDRLKKRISFKNFNLQNNYDTLGKFDLVLCRNVIIYFSDELKGDVLNRISTSINDDGALMLGCSESFIGFMNDYKINDFQSAFYYTKKKD